MITTSKKDNYKTLRAKFFQLKELYEEKEQEVLDLEERIEELEQYEDSDESESDSDICSGCSTLQSKLTERNQLYGRVAHSLGEARDTVSTLEDKVKELEAKVTELEDSSFWCDEWDTKDDEIQKLNDSLKSSKGKVSNQKKHINGLLCRQKNDQKKIKELEDSLALYKQAYSDVYYQREALLKTKADTGIKDKHTSLLKKLEELLQCPINLELMKEPVLTPSGNTLDKQAMEPLICSKKKDPFTRQGFCKVIKPNYLVKQILEAFHEFK